MQGNLLQLPGKELFVDEACSGVQSFFSLLFLIGVYSLIMRRTWLQGILLLLTVLPWSVVMNTVRIYGIVWLDGKIPYDLSQGTPHEIWGTLVFILAFVFMLSTEQFILFFTSTVKFKNVDYLFTEIDNNHLTETKVNVSNPEADEQGLLGLVNYSKLVASSLLAGCMVLLLTPQLRGVVPHLNIYAAKQHEAVLQAVQLDNRAMELGEKSLPEKLGESQQIRFKTDKRGMHSIYGHHSRVWSYALGNKQLHFSVDFPFYNEVHDLTKCYRGQGWQIASYCERSLAQNTEKAETYLVFNIFNQLEEHGTVISSSLDPESVYRSGFRSKYADTPSNKPVSPGKPLPTGAYYQVQLLVNSPEKLTELEIQTCELAYHQVRETLRKALKASE